MDEMSFDEVERTGTWSEEFLKNHAAEETKPVVLVSCQRLRSAPS